MRGSENLATLGQTKNIAGSRSDMGRRPPVVMRGLNEQCDIMIAVELKPVPWCSGNTKTLQSHARVARSVTMRANAVRSPSSRRSGPPSSYLADQFGPIMSSSGEQGPVRNSGGAVSISRQASSKLSPSMLHRVGRPEA